MDGFNNNRYNNHNLANDINLTTTTKNFQFKYNASEHLESIISSVKQDSSGKAFRKADAVMLNSTVEKLCAPYPNRQLLYQDTQETTDALSNNKLSKDTIVTVMSQSDVDAMLKSSFKYRPSLPHSYEQTMPNIWEEENKRIENASNTPDEDSSSSRQTQIAIPKLSVEFLPNPLPQWVEINPIQMATYKLLQYSRSDGTRFKRDQFCLNLNSINNNYNDDDRNTNNDDSCTRDDHTPSTHFGAENSAISIGVESTLNENERAEMNRVMKASIYNMPYKMGNDLEDCNDTSDRSGEECDTCNEYSNSSGEGVGRNMQPVVLIQQFNRQTGNKQEDKALKPSSSDLSVNKASSGKPSKTVQKDPQAVKSAVKWNKKFRNSMESLKDEKIRIFSKITSYHEQLIDLAEIIRLILLDIDFSKTKQYEEKIREKNAFEFSVRLSRNYIFPLKTMIEFLEAAPQKDYTSAVTNIPCIKVCGMYGLLHEALVTYHNHLQYIIPDFLPKKIMSIAELVISATEFCLDKLIFDKHDALIKEIFKEFSLLADVIGKLEEEEKQWRLKKNYVKESGFYKTSSKWDLTMNLNSLNMYEPKSIPKRIKRKSITKSSITMRQMAKSKESLYSRASAGGISNIKTPIPDDIETQMSKMRQSGGLKLVTKAIDEHQSNEIAKEIVDTLRVITKDEVRFMLDAILKNPHNKETLGSVISVLKTQLESLGQEENTVASLAITTVINDCPEAPHGSEASTEIPKTCSNHSDFEHYERVLSSSSDSSIVTIGKCHAKENYISDDANYEAFSVTVAPKKLAPSQSIPESNMTPKISSSRVATKNMKTQRSSLLPVFSSTVEQRKIVRSETKATTVNAETTEPSKEKKPVINNRVNLTRSEKLPPPCPLPQRPLTPTGEYSEFETVTRLRSKFPPAEIQKPSHLTSQHRRLNNTKKSQGNGLPANPPPSPRDTKTVSNEIEHVNYYPNVLYTFIKSSRENIDIKSTTAAASAEIIETPKKSTTPIDSKDEVPKVPISTPELNDVPDEECFMHSSTKLLFRKLSNDDASNSIFHDSQERNYQEEIKSINEERSRFIEKCKTDPLYNNSQFAAPWKVLSNISQNLAQNIVGELENEISFGEETYIRDFINMEMQL